MKRYSRLSRGSGYCLLNLVLIFLLVFLLIPTNAPSVNAESDNNTQEILPPSENITEDMPPEIDNIIPDTSASDNTTFFEETIEDDIDVDIVPPGDNLTFEIEPPDISVREINPNEEADLLSPSGKIKLHIPEGLINKAAKFEIKEHNPLSSASMNMVKLFELDATESDSKEKVKKFKKDYEITIQHTAEELAGLDLDSLHLYYLDEQTRRWVLVPSTLDRETLTLTASIDHFSYFGEQANPLQNGPGRVMAAEVDLHSGAATYSYPIELPPGPGGFSPSLMLTYNSGSVDGMKNKRDMGSWVGIGWSLHLGRISCELTTNKYFLDLNGGSYEIYSSNGTDYKTRPEQYFKITRSGNTWEVRDREGVLYRFGGTTDSEQYVYESSKKYYRWDLSLIEDTNGNKAYIAYTQEIRGTAPNDTVRSAYTANITYGNNLVLFTTVYDEIDPTDGGLRYDNPKSYGSNPAPKIMETRRLDAIEIKSDGSLLRKYAFNYTTTNRVYSEDYDGIYYSGHTKLNSITQYGSDGTSALPAISFSYANKQVYRITNETQYVGNPGNPASLYWPFLTVIDSGYGGSVSFTYTRIPSTSVYNTWTRQAVTTKTANSGIGAIETYNYDYTGNPQYLGTGWEQQFRGWNEVKETDVAGNYVKHYFYTTGTINGKDTDKLTGKEHKTEWYDSSNNLLNTKTYDWDYETLSLIGWNYRKLFTIAGSTAGAQTDYQLKLTVYKGSGTDSGNSVYLNSHCKSNFSDIRFTNADGETLLDYWIESYTADTSAVVWVEFDSIPASPGTASFYIYYGNDSASSASNGDSTFAFFDGFSGTSLDTSKWYNSGDVSVANGLCTITEDTDYQYSHISAKYTQLNGAMHCRASFSSRRYINSIAWGGVCYFWTDVWQQFRTYDGVDTTITDTSGSINTMYLWDIYRKPGWARGCRDSQVEATHTTNIPTTPGCIFFQCSTYNGINKITVDYAFFRKWVDPEPAFSTWGNQTQLLPIHSIHLNQADEITYNDSSGNQTSRTLFTYDDYGNIITQYMEGDINTDADDAVVYREFFPNTSLNILSKVAREWVTDSSNNTAKETLYYYDSDNTTYDTPPTKGNLTRLEQRLSAYYSVNSTLEYDSYGNILTSTDPNDDITAFTYDATHTYPATKTLPVTGLVESYTYDWNWTSGSDNGTVKITTTDVNGNDTISYYDTFDRLWKVVKPGDSYASPSIVYQYNWDTNNITEQNITTIIKIDDTDTLWQKEYFDGLGRVVQTHNNGESGHTIISSTTIYNNRGMVEKQYVPQDIASILTSYQTPDISWRYTSLTYDALGRVISQTNADNTTVSRDFSYAWQDLVTNANGHKTRYHYDAFNRLRKVTEYSDNMTVYATTSYAYDVLGNLLLVTDDDGNSTNMTYDWLARKTHMSDPDMGLWSYDYDDNGNLTAQTDAKGQTINMTYDALDRLTGKSGTGLDVSYVYDEGVNGKGKRTSMTDSTGTTNYKYDARGRVSEEKRTIYSANQTYTTYFAYDGADRLTWIVYPSGEAVEQTYNGRGLPYSLYGTSVGHIVINTFYNHLGAITEITLGNGVKTTYGYYGTGGFYDTTDGYYGRLWEIKTIEPELKEYYLTLTGGGGSVSIPGEGNFDDYDPGTVVPIVAVQNPGYEFVCWTGDTDTIADIYAASTNITMNGNFSISAVFSPIGFGGAGGTVLQHVRYTWDAGGNLSSRYDILTSETETFTYDHLDRLTGVSGPYTESYTYNTIGNIMSRNGTEYLYGDPAHKHAVTSIGAKAYAYDANGNMTYRAGQTLTWDAENRLTSVTENSTVIAQFFYDGNGNRIKKIETGETILYINKYFEVNLTTGNATSYYYHGGTLVAKSENGTLSYIHQDHLTSTSLMTDANANQLGTTVKYLPFGEARAAIDIPTDKLFTGQRLDATGLYYYNARYYDAMIGRFISPDTVIPNPTSPQSFNRYSYCLNNPLKYVDPSGSYVIIVGIGDVQDLGMESLWWLTNMSNQAQEQVMNTLGAYEAFKGSSNIWGAWAKTMETSQEHNVIIRTDDLGSARAAETVKSGNDYIITLNTNRANSFFEGRVFQQGGALADRIRDNILVTRPDFNSYTNWSNIAGALPIVSTPGKIINSWQTFWGTLNDISQIKQGNLNYWGLVIDAVSFGAMFYPPTMIFAGTYQFFAGAIRAQDAFDARRILKGGYEFK